MRFGNETSQQKHSMAVSRPLHESAQPALFSGPTPSFPSLESEDGTSRWGDILSWQGTFGPRTTRPGDTWSSYKISDDPAFLISKVQTLCNEHTF